MGLCHRASGRQGEMEPRICLIQASGGTDDQMRVFYTALYHVLLQPNVFTDVNGEYIGFDDQVRVAQGYTHYANYSGWDIYRTQVQLLALLHPKETSDMIQSLVVDEQQGEVCPFGLWLTTTVV